MENKLTFCDETRSVLLTSNDEIDRAIAESKVDMFYIESTTFSYLITVWDINDAVMGIRAYNVVGMYGDGRLTLVSPNGELDPIVDGSVKFDGCTNLTWGEEGILHTCSGLGIVKSVCTELELLAKEYFSDHKDTWEEICA